MAVNTDAVSPGVSAVRPIKWWGAIALVFVMQLGVIFWLGEKGAPPVQPAPPGVQMRLLPRFPALLSELTDPTLFALPHRQSFSGPAWMAAPQPPTNFFVWSEPPRWLELSVTPLDLSMPELAASNAFSLVDAIATTEVEPREQAVAPMNPFAQHSTWRLTDDLAGRGLLTPLALTSQRSDELLTNSVVQLVVDARGLPVSQTLLPPGSGSKEADQEALSLAAKARFEPLPGWDAGPSGNVLSGLRWGNLVFEWHTIAFPATNAPPEGPK